MDPSDIQLGRAWRHSIAEQTGSVLCWHIFLCFILSSCHVSLVYFSREAMNFTVYTLLPSSVWLSQHVLHWLTCKLRTWMVYSNSICSLVSGIEMGIGKTRLSLPHFSMSSSMGFLIYDVPKIVASAKKLQLPSPPHACSLSPIANLHLFANVINKWSPTWAHQSPIIDGLRLNLSVCRSCNRMQPRKWSIF